MYPNRLICPYKSSCILKIIEFYLDFKSLVIENVLRPSGSSLIININEHDLSFIKIDYCVEQINSNSFKFCSTSNKFNQLISGSIYNISVSISRNSFNNTFIWTKKTVVKLVNTGKKKHIFILILSKLFQLSLKSFIIITDS